MDLLTYFGLREQVCAMGELDTADLLDTLRGSGHQVGDTLADLVERLRESEEN